LVAAGNIRSVVFEDNIQLADVQKKSHPIGFVIVVDVDRIVVNSLSDK